MKRNASSSLSLSDWSSSECRGLHNSHNSWHGNFGSTCSRGCSRAETSTPLMVATGVPSARKHVSTSAVRSSRSSLVRHPPTANGQCKSVSVAGEEQMVLYSGMSPRGCTRQAGFAQPLACARHLRSVCAPCQQQDVRQRPDVHSIDASLHLYVLKRSGSVITSVCCRCHCQEPPCVAQTLFFVYVSRKQVFSWDLCEISSDSVAKKIFSSATTPPEQRRQQALLSLSTLPCASTPTPQSTSTVPS